MPIILDDIQSTQIQVKTYDPKFFSSDLTGSNTSRGILAKHNNPQYLPDTVDYSMVQDYPSQKVKTVNGNTTSWSLPFLLSPHLHPNGVDVLPQCPSVQINDNTYIMITPASIQVDITKNKDSTSTKQNILYCINIYQQIDNNNPYYTTISKLNPLNHQQRQNTTLRLLTANPHEYIKRAMGSLNQFDKQAWQQYIDSYSNYDALCGLSEFWQTKIELTFNAIINSNLSHEAKYQRFKKQLYYINNHNVSIQSYQKIYTLITQNFDLSQRQALCQQNLNLLLSETLNELNDKKAQLTTIPTPPQPTLVPSHYTPAQKNIILDESPLILVQSAAGTGKSTTLLARIEYMKQLGIPQNEITVLSFTNAAADNIKQRNPDVTSMTIASMIHDIYTYNHPLHNLSTIETLINTIQIQYHHDQIADLFISRLRSILFNRTNAYVHMCQFIEENYDKIIEILDTTQQTTLELEIIICYLKIDIFNEPTSLQTKYMIVDEVQDNSIFEFIYTLKYVNKHNQNLMIIGDGSQTLYEFRASDPRALNILEASNIFSTHQLQINYRSNQEILTFANISLAEIEANTYANLRLQSNHLTTITEQSFKDKVKIIYKNLDKISRVDEILPNWLNETEMQNYIQDKLNQNQKITFLAYTNRHVRLIENTLKQLYPNHTIANLAAERAYSSTIFSTFIKKYWENITTTPSQQIVHVICNEIITKIDHLVNTNASKVMFTVHKILNEWQSTNLAQINVWFAQYQAKQITKAEFFDYIKNTMLDFEIKNNAIKQRLTANKNEERRKQQLTQNAHFVVSTIHSAKGLEFDNVVVLHRNEAKMEEDKKRMYYVAFTRAINSEYIISYDTVKSPKILSDYQAILNQLNTTNAKSKK